MILHSPFSIGSRLLPAIQIGDGTISLEFVGCASNRMVYRWFIDIPAGEFSEADLKSGCHGAGYQKMFGSLLAFLGAAAEAKQYQDRTGRESDNADLFPPEVVEWAAQHSDEISLMQFEIEECGEVLIEE